MIYVGRCLGGSSRVVHIGGAVAAVSAPCADVISALSALAKLNDVVGLGGVLHNCSRDDLGRLAAPHRAYVFASDAQNIVAFQPDGTDVTMANAEVDEGLRGQYQNPLFLKTPIGRVLVLTNRQILHTEHYTTADADLIVSVHGQTGDE
jgi:hypothetical protein